MMVDHGAVLFMVDDGCRPAAILSIAGWQFSSSDDYPGNHHCPGDVPWQEGMYSTNTGLSP